MSLIRTLAVLVLALAFATPAFAGGAGETWRIVESAGAVKAGGAGLTPIAVTSNQVLPADSWVETAATGRAILVRGTESIAVGPNSRVQLPSLEVNGNTQVLQTLGSALYQIGKQQKPHFQVDTPYLAAVVKGTTFTVTVEETTSLVQVTEGLVEVATPDRAAVEFVRPGFTGMVSRDHRGDVVVVQSERGPVAPPKGGTSDSKAKDKSTANDPRAKFASSALGSPGRVVIANTIGEEKLDVKSVSGGLAFNATEAVAKTTTSSAHESTSTKTTGVLANATTAVMGVVGEAAAPTVSPTVEVGPVVVAVDVGAGAAPDVGGGVSVDVDAGGGSGTGSGSGNVGVDVAVGNGSGGVSVDVAVGPGNGGGVGLALGAGHGIGGLGIGLGGGNAGGNGNGS